MTDPDLRPREAKERYLDHRRTEVADDTIRGFNYRLKQFVEWCEEQQIDRMSELNGWKLDQFENHRRGDDLAPASLTSEMQTLKNFLEYLARIEVVEDNLPEKVHVPTIPEGDKSNDEMLHASSAKHLVTALREDPEHRGTAKHALLELLWFTGARLGAMRALDLEDYHSDEQYVEFHHRPDSDTPLKNDRDGERAVGLPPRVCEVLDWYLKYNRSDVYDDAGRSPFFTTSVGRASHNTVRIWSYKATQPCLFQDCPHGKERETCEFLGRHQASKCPSSVSPHRIRTGSITWQRDQGIPAEIVSKRVNATLEVIERHYDKATKRERLENRRRPYIEDLQFEAES